ncbi:uncharacterized protein ARMOST_17196 [Armillaria ostoyae]|uniref:Protein kinase domain-containing protein n=1 Tax=Armillaria ostoyae TaxID=47428 RepID=A0A284RYC7_ARMOS|nr:uncharacterized protein ARMOST_17196 [Armillaria ostoyae]
MAYSSSQIPSAYEPSDSGYYNSNASYVPPSSDVYGGKRSILSAHTDPSTRPTTYNQLIDYLGMLAVQVINPADLSIGKSIGVGATFYVQEGTLNNHTVRSALVAVKTPRESVHKDTFILSSLIREVLDEIRVMSYFSLHPNVISIFGVCLQKSGEERLLPRVIVDRAVGSLGSLLRKSSSNGGEGMPWELKMKFSLEVAAGLEALHQIEIVHADVKADNVLIFYDAKNWDVQTVPQLYARVSDFGFCVPDTSSRAAYAASRGTIRFRAPEALAEAPPSLRQYANQPERDVYSYGVLLWEIFNDGNIPFVGVDSADVAALQLDTEDGAAKHLIATFRGKNGGSAIGPLGAINGAVQRDPQRRSKWQEIFDVICASSDIRYLSPDPNHSFVDYFTQSWCRQREISWNIFQAQGLWLPTIPIPSTSSADDGTYSDIVLRELENSIQSRPSDWITMIRLALHYFMTRDLGIMENLLRRFVESDVVELGEYGSPLLHLAVRVDAVDVIRALLVKGVDVHAADIIEDQTPLHAVRSIEAARALIEFGANVNALKRATPLHTCISADIAEVLLQNGADINAPDSYHRSPALHTARSADIVRVLLKYGADPLSEDRFGDTALHRAVSDEVAQCLMETCPELVHVKGLLDGSPLHRRVADWSAETIRMAIRLGADVDAPNSDGDTALLRSHEFTGALSDVEVVRTLIEAGAKVPLPKGGSLSSTPLHETVSPPLMEYLLEHGFQPYVNIRRTTDEQTPLHVVAARDMALHKSWSSRYAKEDRRGGEPESSSTKYGGIAHLLEQSSSIPSVDLMKVLLKYGADPNTGDDEGDTPLHFVARNFVGHPGHLENLNLIRLLLEAGADISARNSAGETPLHCAARAETVFEFLRLGADPTLADHQGVTILHNAWRFTGDCERVVEALTEHGADVDAADKQGSRPLHYACRGYEKDSLGLSQVQRWARSTCFHHGTPPLEPTIYAAFENALPIVRALLDRRADIHAQNKAGETAVKVALRHPFGREVFRFLCERGADISEVPRPWWNFD